MGKGNNRGRIRSRSRILWSTTGAGSGASAAPLPLVLLPPFSTVPAGSWKTCGRGRGRGCLLAAPGGGVMPSAFLFTLLFIRTGRLRKSGALHGGRRTGPCGFCPRG
ncbi:hypothetical protein IWX49DRAFT_572128 [Phyllosticta citricarpa]